MAQRKPLKTGKRRIAKKKKKFGFNKKAAMALVRDICEADFMPVVAFIFAVLLILIGELNFQTRFDDVRIEVQGGQTAYQIIEELNPDANAFDLFQMKARFALSHLDNSTLKAGKEYVFFQPANKTSNEK